MNETLGALVDRLRAESQNIRQNRPGPFELKDTADRLDGIAADLLVEAKGKTDETPSDDTTATNVNQEVKQ